MRPPTFPVAPSTIAEYCVFASAAVAAAVATAAAAAAIVTLIYQPPRAR
jgi:hypothetical protein